MIKSRMSKEQWGELFSHAKHGHTLWDGTAPDPHNPIHAHTTAWQFVNYAKEFGFFKKGDKILDLGCGNGRFAIPFSEMDLTYEGTDPMEECIDFCKTTFKPFPHLRFTHTPIHSPEYGLFGDTTSENYRIDHDNETFDNVIVYSVFTHLQTLPAATNYANEVIRVLKPKGRLFCTWYRSPPNKSPDTFIGRTVYNEWDIMTMLKGFEFLHTYGGHTDAYYDQWALFCVKS